MPMISHFPFIGYSVSSFIHISLGLLSTKHHAPCWKCQAEHCMFSKSAQSRGIRPLCAQTAGTASLRSAVTEIWTGHQSKQSRGQYDKLMVYLYAHHCELEQRHSSEPLILSIGLGLFCASDTCGQLCCRGRGCSWRYWLWYSVSPEKNEN